MISRQRLSKLSVLLKPSEYFSDRNFHIFVALLTRVYNLASLASAQSSLDWPAPPTHLPGSPEIQRNKRNYRSYGIYCLITPYKEFFRLFQFFKIQFVL